jgi:hypothetical protein
MSTILAPIVRRIRMVRTALRTEFSMTTQNDASSEVKASAPQRIGVRVFLTALLLSVFGFFSNLFADVSTVESGKAAVAQLENSDRAAIQAKVTMRFFDGSLPLWVVILALFVPLFLIWRKPLANLFRENGKSVAGALVLGLFLTAGYSHNAWAIFDEGNPEYVEIQPNQTAFMIPMEGANLTNQGKFMSEEYLNSNKVGYKRVKIEYQRFSTKDGTVYLPSSKLVLVDRSPITREWVASATRGTSNSDQAIRGETAESIDMHTGIILSAFVKEEDAAKFLYWYAAGMRNRNGSSSISDARSLADVVDTNVRGMVQSVFAREIGRRNLYDAVRQKADIIEMVRKEVTEAFAKQGITITNLGYAEGFTFSDTNIQSAINRNFIAKMDADTAKEMKDAIPVLKARAEIDNSVKQADAMVILAQRYGGGVPSTVMMPSEHSPLLNLLQSFVPNAGPVGGKQ